MIVNAGRLNVPNDAALGAATLGAGPLGTIRYTASANTARTFNLAGGVLEAPAGVNVTFGLLRWLSANTAPASSDQRLSTPRIPVARAEPPGRRICWPILGELSGWKGNVLDARRSCRQAYAHVSIALFLKSDPAAAHLPNKRQAILRHL